MTFNEGDDRMTRCSTLMVWLSLSLAVIGLAIAAPEAQAQNRLGGHIGAVVPLVTRVGGETITVGDDFTIGVPTGLTLRKNDRVAFDFEFVPSIQNEPLSVSLTVHPGVIFSMPRSFAAGLRMAFDVGAASWGFTPLVARSFPVQNGSWSVFLELDVPIRFQEDAFGANRTAVTLAAHAGIGF
jgi:hypothetical protein